MDKFRKHGKHGKTNQKARLKKKTTRKKENTKIKKKKRQAKRENVRTMRESTNEKCKNCYPELR